MKTSQRRPSITLVVSIGILLCAAVYWPRGRTRGEGVMIFGDGSVAAIATGTGCVSLAAGKVDLDAQYINAIQPFSSDVRDLAELRESVHGLDEGMLRRIGIRFDRADWLQRRDAAPFAAITLPWWLITLAASIAPIRLLRRRQIERLRVLRGECRACGYDLRASADRCPECGAAAADGGHYVGPRWKSSIL